MECQVHGIMARTWCHGNLGNAWNCIFSAGFASLFLGGDSGAHPSAQYSVGKFLEDYDDKTGEKDDKTGEKNDKTHDGTEDIKTTTGDYDYVDAGQDNEDSTYVSCSDETVLYTVMTCLIILILFLAGLLVKMVK